MINDTLDLADELAIGLKHETAGEALPTDPHVCAGIVPQQSVFIVNTISGKRFRVIVKQEPQ